MSDNDKKEFTQIELNQYVQQEVEKEKLAILIADFKSHKDEEEKRLIAIDKNIHDIYHIIRTFPDRVTQCRNDLEKDIHEELEKHYVTSEAMELAVQDLTNQIRMIKVRFTWTVGLIVAIGGLIQFLTTMAFMGYQLQKLIGGG